MTGDPDPRTTGRSTASEPRTRRSSLRSLSRRDALRAAGAGVGTALLGSAATSAAAAELPRLQVDGNLVVTEDGEQVTLRGLNVIDPKRGAQHAPSRGRDVEQVLDLVTGEGWHPDVIRVPAQPIDVGDHPPGHEAGPAPVPAYDREQLERYLEDYYDPIVEACAERGVYAIVDYHRHWTEEGSDEPQWGYQDEGTVNRDLLEETRTFWQTVAPRYADRDHVLFEIYNEPTAPGMWGAIGQDWVDFVWELFLEFVQPIVDDVREHTDALTLVGSPGWTQSPEGALIEPVDGENLGYTYHAYPGHEASQANDWEDSGINGQGVEAVYEEHPLFVTEFGWEPDLDFPVGGTTESFGLPFLEWLESSDAIHWTGWVADVWWEPRLFETAFEPPEDEETTEDGISIDCPDRPCEWHLLGSADGEEQYMGEFVRRALEVEGVPQDYVDVADDADEGTESDDGSDDGVTDVGGEDDEATDDEDEGVTDDGDGLPGFGVGAGAVGVAGGVARLLRRRRSEDAANDRAAEGTDTRR